MSSPHHGGADESQGSHSRVTCLLCTLRRLCRSPREWTTTEHDLPHPSSLTLRHYLHRSLSLVPKSTAARPSSTAKFKHQEPRPLHRQRGARPRRAHPLHSSRLSPVFHILHLRQVSLVSGPDSRRVHCLSSRRRLVRRRDSVRLRRSLRTRPSPPEDWEADRVEAVYLLMHPSPFRLLMPSSAPNPIAHPCRRQRTGHRFRHLCHRRTLP